jgi:hypothetical protein
LDILILSIRQAGHGRDRNEHCQTAEVSEGSMRRLLFKRKRYFLLLIFIFLCFVSLVIRVFLPSFSAA